jgi:cytochrome c oxidase subunit 2
MNCVPGMTTQFHMVPKTTTVEMRTITGNDEFNYILLCNKICGGAHYNMQMDIIVESEEDYQAWLAEQKTFAQTNGTEEIEVTEVAEPSAEESEENAEGDEAEVTDEVMEEPAHS